MYEWQRRGTPQADPLLSRNDRYGRAEKRAVLYSAERVLHHLHLYLRPGENLPMYTFRHRCIEKEGLELGDLSTKIFLNAKGESDTLDPDIAAFLRYVDGKAAEGALTKEINEEVIRIKEHKEMRREYMTLLMELQKYKTEGMEEGIEIGMEKKSRTVIVNLLKLNMPIDNIAAATESPIPYVKEIAREAGYSV